MHARTRSLALGPVALSLRPGPRRLPGARLGVARATGPRLGSPAGDRPLRPSRVPPPPPPPRRGPKGRGQAPTGRARVLRLRRGPLSLGPQGLRRGRGVILRPRRHSGRRPRRRASGPRAPRSKSDSGGAADGGGPRAEAGAGAGPRAEGAEGPRPLGRGRLDALGASRGRLRRPRRGRRGTPSTGNSSPTLGTRSLRSTFITAWRPSRVTAPPCWLVRRDTGLNQTRRRRVTPDPSSREGAVHGRCTGCPGSLWEGERKDPGIRASLVARGSDSGRGPRVARARTAVGAWWTGPLGPDVEICPCAWDRAREPFKEEDTLETPGATFRNGDRGRG